MSFYDRARWPTPMANPLVIMLEREDDWYSNTEIVAALGYTGSVRSLIGQWPSLAEQLGESETALLSRGLMVPDATKQRTGGQERYFSRKALVLIIMRA